MKNIDKYFFVFHPILMKIGEVVASTTTIKFDEKQKGFIYSPI